AVPVVKIRRQRRLTPQTCHARLSRLSGLWQPQVLGFQEGRGRTDLHKRSEPPAPQGEYSESGSPQAKANADLRPCNLAQPPQVYRLSPCARGRRGGDWRQAEASRFGRATEAPSQFLWPWRTA